METVGVEPTSSSLQARRSSSCATSPQLIEEQVRTGGVEPPSTRRQGYSLLSSPLLSVRELKGWPAGLEPAPTGITTPGASDYTTATA